MIYSPRSSGAKATRMIGLRALQATIVVLYLLSDTCAKSVCSDKEDFHLVQFNVLGENKVTKPGHKLIFVCDGPSNHLMDVIDVETKSPVNNLNNAMYLPEGCERSENTSCYFIVTMSANETDGKRYRCRSTNHTKSEVIGYSETRNITGE